MPLSEEDILTFAKTGYIHLKGAIPEKQINQALKVIDKAYEDGNHGYNTANPKDKVPSFKDDVSKHPKIVQLLTESKAWNAVSQLIGNGSAVKPVLAQVALREPSEHWKSQGWDVTTSIDSIPWHIDGGAGLYAYVGSPFTMLVGVCLSEGQDNDSENHGQFLVWPGSHLTLHPLVADRVKKGLITDPYSVFNDIERPDIGKPIRVPMKPGDVVLAHQRLGHTGGPNLGSTVRKNLYFRVSHKKHEKFLKSGELLNGWVWAQYNGVRNVLEKHGPPK